MTLPKDFAAAVGSDMRASQKRVLFVTRRTSAHVKSHDEEKVHQVPHLLTDLIWYQDVMKPCSADLGLTTEPDC